MARTLSKMMPLGTKAPTFELKDTVSGKEVRLIDASGKVGTVVAFICNHCPFVKHVVGGVVDLAGEYQSKGISFFAISANDPNQYPEDAPDRMRDTAQRLNFPFPYLFDETQAVAKAFDAACTPDFYIFDSALSLVYRGQLDDSRPDNGIQVTGKDIRAALDALIEGRPVSPEQKPSMGCNIKWRDM